MRITDHGALSPGVPARDGMVRMDCRGMRCPQPVLKLAVETANTPAGTIVEILGDCPTFEDDVRVFCARRKKTILATLTDGRTTAIRIRC